MKTLTKSLMGVLLIATSTTVVAQDEQSQRGQGAGGQGAERSLTQRLLACRDIESAVERLDCFDRLARVVGENADGERGNRMSERGEEAREAAQARAEERQEQARQRAEEAREEAETRQQQGRADDYGREHRRDVESDEDRRYIEITEAWQNPRGLWRFRLADGAEWHQLQSGYFQYDEDATYFIERGMLSSFQLGSDGSNRNIRVRRVD